MTVKEENLKWMKHEAFELIKQVSAVIVALVTLGGFLVTTWGYLDWWVPISAQKHSEDMKAIQSAINTQYNQLKRETLMNRLEVMQMRVTNIATEVHNIEDAIAIHQRAIVNPQVPDMDKEIARRRVITLTDTKESWVTRQRALYNHMDKIREAMVKLPYDPRLGSMEEYSETIPPMLGTK